MPILIADVVRNGFPKHAGRLLALVCLWFFASVAFGSSEDAAADETAVRGSLVIIGGSERFNHREYWDEIVELAGGPGAKIAVFPTASGDPVKKGGWVISALNKSGADAFLVPVAWRIVEKSPQEAVSDPDLVAQVLDATGVFLIGGEQDKIVKALFTDKGEHTPMLDAMWSVYRKGGVIAGTSAGAAVMSRIMYRDAESVLDTMLKGVRWGKEIDRGLGFIDPEWFVDQHLFVRGRFARTLVAMQNQGFKYGIGVDENSAIIVTNGKDVRVIGYKGALVFDLSKSEHDPALGRFNLKNARLTYLDRGDRFDLKTREVLPAQEKLDDEKLDPKSPDYRPVLRRPLFCNDILGNTTVIDLMGTLMESVNPVATGLAFDGNLAQKQSVDGFEFKFSRDEESIAWYTEYYGGDDYTVVNIRLDIQPIRITGPFTLDKSEAALIAGQSFEFGFRSDRLRTRTEFQMVYLNRIYTKTGDTGETSLGNGQRVPKTNVRIIAYGAVDELNAQLGVVLASDQSSMPFGAQLLRIQNDLFDVGADLCVPESDEPLEYTPLRVTAEQVTHLEQLIDQATSQLQPLTSFILPGGSLVAARLHVARTVCRRAEIEVVRLAAAEKVNPNVAIYLNRLSDLLFVMSRVANRNGQDDILWVPGANRTA